jgi:dUTP pyrophosphatase
MKVKFKKLHEGAILPKKATDGSAAYDLYVAEDIIIEAGRQVIPLGFAMEMESGYEALVDPRSGFSSKGMEGYEVVTLWTCKTYFGNITGFCISGETENAQVKEYVARSPERFDCDVTEGKIDSDYRDEVGVIVHNRDSRIFMIKAGTRIAQMTFHKVESVDWEEVEELSESDRKGGFGHTGTK